MENISALADRCLALPDDYSPGSDEEGITWGRIGVSYNRDSGPSERTIAEFVFEKLHGQFPDDFKWQHASHWGFGWCKEILVRVKDADGEITDAFIEAAKYGDHFDPAWDEQCALAIIAAEREATLENIEREWPSVLKYPDNLERHEAHEAVLRWLHEADIQAGGDDGTWFSSDEITMAGLHLGYWDLEWTGEDEFFEALIEFAEPTEFLADEFRRWCYALWRVEHEKTQGVLFDA